MMVITEVALTLFAGIFLCFYAADTLYWIYKEEKEQQETAEKEAEDEKIKEHVAKTLYN